MNFPSLTKAPVRLKNFCLLLVCLASSLTMLACGGGGGGSTGGSDVPSNNPPQPPVLSTLSPGAYVWYEKDNKTDGKDWVGIVLPTSGSGNSFFGLHFYYANAQPPRFDPDLYSGIGKISGQNTADLSSVALFEDFTKQNPTIGTGTFSSLSNGSMKIDFSFQDPINKDSKRIAIPNAIAPEGFSSNSTASLSSIVGKWTGRWSYGGVSLADFQITISPDGSFTSSGPFQTECVLTEAKLTPTDNSLFTLALTIPPRTLCTSFGGRTLNGAAFVHKSPVAGKTLRLYLVGITSDGRGISFKADR